MKVLLLPLIITILAWVLKHNANKDNDPDRPTVRSFMDRESAANGVRRRDISDLPYITAPISSFPLDITLNDAKKQSQIENYRKDILRYAELPKLNLIGVTNTQLKEQYGPANLEFLTACDNNYSLYLRNLYLYANAVYDTYPSEAAFILSYCISVGTDISGIYELLGRYYLEHGKSKRFEELYDKIPDRHSVSGKMILNKLERVRAAHSA